MFKICNFSVKIGDNIVVKSIHASFAKGSVHAIMGPNGSGKSSLAYALMGHPRYTISEGTVFLCGNDFGQLTTDQRARAGLFLALQHPIEVPGLQVFNFLKEAYCAVHGTISLQDFQGLLYGAMDMLEMDHSFAHRGVHEGFSGGEKKKLELLQLLLLKPKVAILDEIDSGLDVDALKIVARGIMQARTDNPDLIVIMITHYQRILRYVKPDFVHIMQHGKLVRSGDARLAEQIEQNGYEDGHVI